jgi:heme/copper-type cytochrome/quinol oxidase subunit 2
MVISVVIKAIESKLGPTGWARAAALWDLFSNFKWFIVTLIGLYVTVYSIALIANYVSGSNIVNPASFASELLYRIFFGPFIELWKNTLT